MGGIQAGLIIGLRAAHARHMQWPLTVMAVLSAALLALGVLSHYRDIWKHRTVRGISFIFVGIDAAGDVFSLLSVLFERRVDALAVAIYATEFVLWCGVFACGGWYNLRPWIKTWLRDRRLAHSKDGGGAVESTDQEGGGIALHQMPSSTSVFTTPGAAMEVRERVGHSSSHIQTLDME